jgi:purine-binding chemotaxis protein CheW
MMKNVIIVAVNKSRYAVELRWIREVFTLGHVTPVPHAPDTIAGVTNFRGSIMTVLDLPTLLRATGERGIEAPRRLAVFGDNAVVIETEDLRAALRVDNVAEVATLRQDERENFVDAHARPVTLLSPPVLLATAVSATHAVLETRKRKPS